MRGVVLLLFLLLAMVPPPVVAGYSVNLYGYVLNAGSEEPLKQATVEAWFPHNGGQSIKATTDESGAYSLNLPHPGTWFFGFSLGDYQPIPWNSPHAIRVDLHPSQNGGSYRIANARLTGTLGGVTGYVMLNDGCTPLAGAAIGVNGVTQIYSDPLGRFFIPRLKPGFTVFTCTKAPYPQKIINISIEANVVSSLQFILEAPPVVDKRAFIRGRLVYPPDAIDFLRRVNGFNKMKVRIPSAPEANIDFVHDSNGIFYIRNLLASTTHSLAFETPGFIQSASNTSTIALRPGENVFPDVNMWQLFTNVAGTVITSKGLPARNGKIVFLQLLRETPISGSGTYRILDVPVGYQIELSVFTEVASGPLVVQEGSKGFFVPVVTPEVVLTPIITKPIKRDWTERRIHFLRKIGEWEAEGTVTSAQSEIKNLLIHSLFRAMEGSGEALLEHLSPQNQRELRRLQQFESLHLQGGGR